MDMFNISSTEKLQLRDVQRKVGFTTLLCERQQAQGSPDDVLSEDHCLQGGLVYVYRDACRNSLFGRSSRL